MRKTMLAIGIISGLLGITLGTARAVPVCVSGTLADYLTLTDGCTIGDKLFSDFGYSPSAVGVAPIPASGVAVTPLVDDPATATVDPGIQFSAGWGVFAPNQVQDSLITFDVAVLPDLAPPGTLIEDALLVMTGAANGSGAASVIETICTGGAGPTGDCPQAQQQILTAFDTPGGFDLTDAVTFAPVGLIHVAKDILVVAGQGTEGVGFATISGIIQRYSQTVVPEPGTLLLLGSALAGLGALGRKRLKMNPGRG